MSSRNGQNVTDIRSTPNGSPVLDYRLKKDKWEDLDSLLDRSKKKRKLSSSLTHPEEEILNDSLQVVNWRYSSETCSGRSSRSRHTRHQCRGQIRLPTAHVPLFLSQQWFKFPKTSVSVPVHHLSGEQSLYNETKKIFCCFPYSEVQRFVRSRSFYFRSGIWHLQMLPVKFKIQERVETPWHSIPVRLTADLWFRSTMTRHMDCWRMNWMYKAC